MSSKANCAATIEIIGIRCEKQYGKKRYGYSEERNGTGFNMYYQPMIIRSA
jgi:hypothetical protein